LVHSARGRILELGPGPGNQLQRFDPSHVTTIFGVEPNPYYGSFIAAKLEKLIGLRDKYELLTCGIEDSDVLRKAGVEEGSLDAVVSVQVLCAVRDVRGVVREAWRLLRPGGVFVFWEHGRSGDEGTAVAQACLNPAWSAFVGCSMRRDIKADILDAGEWENPDEIEVADDPYTCLPRIWGVLRKKA
ncbi:Methyltransferase-like protein 7B, partial [Diplodia seriata]